MVQTIIILSVVESSLNDLGRETFNSDRTDELMASLSCVKFKV